MKGYNSINHCAHDKYLFGEKVFAFNKYDGTNIGIEWNYKWRNEENRGFTKFGTRNNRIDETHPDVE